MLLFLSNVAITSSSDTSYVVFALVAGGLYTVRRNDARATIGWNTDLQFKCCQTDSADCLPCGAGYETNAGRGVGGSTCTACAAGQYTSAPGQSCRSCDVGYIADATISRIVTAEMVTLESGCEYSSENSTWTWRLENCGEAIWVGILNNEIGLLTITVSPDENTDRNMSDYVSFLVDGEEVARKYNTNESEFNIGWPGPDHELRMISVSSDHRGDQHMRIVGIIAQSNFSQTGLVPDRAATFCTACATGRYSSASPVACITCPAGSATDTLGSPGASICTACGAGKYSTDSTRACSECGSGYVTGKALAGSYEQVTLAATSCSACPVGQTNSNSTLVCIPVPTLAIDAPLSIGRCGSVHLSALIAGMQFRTATIIAARWSWNGSDVNTTLALNISNTPDVLLQPWYLLRGINEQYRFTVDATALVDSQQLQAYGEVTITKMHADVPEVDIAGPHSLTTLQSRSLVLRATAALPSCGDIGSTTLSFLWSLDSEVSMQLDATTKRTSALYVPAGSLPPNVPVVLRVTVCSTTSICNFDTVTITAEPTPFNVHILGGSFRIVGSSNNFEIEASTSLDTDAAVASEVVFSWICSRDDGVVALTSSSRRWLIEAGSLPIGNYTFAVNATFGRRAGTAVANVRVDPGEPPAVSILLRSTMQSKFNTDQKLALLGSILTSSAADSSECSQCERLWSAQICRVSDCDLSDSWTAVDLSMDGFVMTSLSNLNLVVANGQLRPGASYRFRLDAWVDGLDGRPSGSSTFELLMNAPPTSGQILVSPATGMAVQDTFTLTTVGWVDDDAPFQYRFATSVDDRFSYLSDFDSLTSIGASLANAASNMTIVSVEAQDSLGAIAIANFTATVLPYAPIIVPGSSFASVASGLLNASSSIGNMQRVGQIVLSLAASLNSETSSVGASSDDAMETREVLINAVVDMGQALTPDAVARASQTLSAITAKSAELSEDATDKSLEFATKLSTDFKSSITTNDVTNLAATVSSVLLSSTRLFTATADAGTNSTIADDAALSAAKDTKAQERGKKLSDCVSSLALIVAADQVAGEAQQTFTTSTFVMSVKKDAPSQMANTTIGSGNVKVPDGAFPAGTSAVAASVIEWQGAGPLFHATDQKPVGTESELRTPVLSVSFSDAADEPLSISGLANPFVFNLSAPNGNLSNESALCAHWNTASTTWVTDGRLAARYDDIVTCEFHHLTDFGGFLGPLPTTNTVSNPFDFAKWANNITGAVMSACILACALATCCWSLADYRRQSKIVKRDKDNFDARTTEYVQTKLHAGAKAHAFMLREWLLLRWGCQLCTITKPHSGDPYLRSQRILVFANALLVSLVCSILFFDVPGDDPECCTCIMDAWTNSPMCGVNSTTWSGGNKTCAELSITVGQQHCNDGEEADNGPLSAAVCALLSLPIVATMHLSFRWVRKPLEQFIMVKVLQHEQRNIVVMGATGLAQADTDSMSDPYCRVYFNGMLVGRTKVIVGQNSPTWNAVFNLVDAIGPIPDQENVVRFEIWDHDLLSMDEFLGQLVRVCDASAF